jgi:hypothetical protein
MHFLPFLMLFAFCGSMIFAAYACRCLLKAAQGREDAEDERLWQYLLDPLSI